MERAERPVDRHIVRDLEELETLAIRVAARLRAGDVVALDGPLGSGKTTFVAAMARALHNETEVTSPTFVFWNRYGGTPALEHVDLYRIEDAREAREAGLQEVFAPDRIVFVEWPDRLAHFVPASAIRITFEGAGNEPRTLEIAVPVDRGR